MENLQEALKKHTNTTYTLEEILKHQEEYNGYVSDSLDHAAYIKNKVVNLLTEFESRGSPLEHEYHYDIQILCNWLGWIELQFSNLGSEYVDINIESKYGLDNLSTLIRFIEAGQICVGKDNCIGNIEYDSDLGDTVNSIENLIKNNPG